MSTDITPERQPTHTDVTGSPRSTWDVGLPPARPWRGRPLIAWFFILLAMAVPVGLRPLLAYLRPSKVTPQSYLIELRTQARVLVGMSRFFQQDRTISGKEARKSIEGPYEQRLGFIIVVGELEGPEAALEQLETMRTKDWENHPPDETTKRLADILERWYRGFSKDGPDENAITAEERALLREKLGWFGELALAPESGHDAAAREAVLVPAQTAAIRYLIFMLCLLGLVAFGFIVLVAAVLFVAVGLLRPRFRTGSRDGGVYAETFAVWMVLYLLLELGAGLLIPRGHPEELLIIGLVGLVSLVALGWPVLRGVPWQRVRQDIGWWAPRAGVPEVGWGLGGYVAMFPVLLGALLLSVGLMAGYKHFFPDDPYSVPSKPSHPLGDILANGGAWVYVQCFLVAAVFAPIIEETMFRGVLYRHLREVGMRLPRWVSVVFSAFVCSFVFAVIHPQGVFGVPVLMTLALGFTITRELRGSLVGPMVAHGLNNALVTLLALTMM